MSAFWGLHFCFYGLSLPDLHEIQRYMGVGRSWVWSSNPLPKFKLKILDRSRIVWGGGVKVTQQWVVYEPVVHGAMSCSQESFKLVWRCHQVLFGFLAIDHLPCFSRQSRMSANHKGDYEMIPGAVLRSPGIYIKAEENPKNLS